MEIVVAIIFMYSIFNYNDTATNIVLLENNGKKNEIIIESQTKKTIVNKVNTLATIKNDTSPLKLRNITQEELYRRYNTILENEVKSPISLLMYFESGITLKNESYKELEKMKKEIQKRSLVTLTIIGHSDRLGDEDKNIKLSLKRAKVVEEWIRNQNLDIKEIKVLSYGENDPLIKTKDNVAEPLNRRVEVLIR